MPTHRIDMARKALAKEEKNVERIQAKFDSLVPSDHAYDRVKRDLAQQIAQRDFAQGQLDRALARG